MRRQGPGTPAAWPGRKDAPIDGTRGESPHDRGRWSGQKNPMKKILGIERLLIVFVALVILTIAVIYVSYGPELFRRWSWQKSSLLLSFITCLAPYMVKQEFGESSKENGTVLFYACLLLPLLILLIHPGLHRLGGSSDGKLGALLPLLMIVHGAGFQIVLRGLHLSDQIE